MSDNDNDDNVVSFPTSERLKQVEADRTKPVFGQFGSFSYSFDPKVNLTVSYEGLDKFNPNFTWDTFSNLETFPKDLGVDYDNLSLKVEDDRLMRVMDMCNQIQKRAIYHYSKDHQVLFTHIESLLEQLLQISNLSGNNPNHSG